ncbi:hypothetical protein [Burkholderia sp. LMU1-1-1.1]|uniref:hypothetical protein n=1 Tax=Burkholderia sp. LMU1-1-1.1 TaxID=3135266 RepID=UPI00342BAA8F
MKRLLPLLLAVTCIYSPCNAAEDSSPVESARLPVAADVTFVGTGLSFGTQITAAILQKIGCTYAIRDSETSSKLLKLVSAARDISQADVDSRQKFEVRNKIVFHFKDTNDISVEFSQKFLNQSYLKGNWNSTPVHLRNDLVEEVHATVKESAAQQLNKDAPKSCGIF